MLITLALIGCNPRPQRAPSAVSPTPSPSATSGVPPLHFVGKGTTDRPIHIVQTRGTRTLYEIFARSLEGTQIAGAATSRLHDARIIFHDGHGGRLIATAPIAIVDQLKDEIQLQGRVHTVNSTGLVLDCDTLIVNRGTDHLRGEGHVVMTDPKGLHATGNRVDSNLSFTKVRLQ
ncbi:MAG: hypothetical protein ACYDA1_00220 [Vulcanimicrobiaceae bacterium]